jgi:hypothetical protein
VRSNALILLKNRPGLEFPLRGAKVHGGSSRISVE